jgi:hypothetical protein
VYLQQHRAASRREDPGPVDIQLLADAGGSVGNMPDNLHVGMLHAKGVAPIGQVHRFLESVRSERRATVPDQAARSTLPSG